MASVKIILWTAEKDRKNDGTFPLAIRITKDRKSRYVFTGQYILEKDWDKGQSRVRKSHPNSARLNNLLLTKLAEANNTVLELDTNNEYASSKEIKNRIKKTGNNVSFFDVAKQRIDDYKKKGTFSVSNADQSIAVSYTHLTLPTIYSV